MTINPANLKTTYSLLEPFISKFKLFPLIETLYKEDAAGLKLMPDRQVLLYQNGAYDEVMSARQKGFDTLMQIC